MGFVEAIKSVFSKYAVFSGRSRRSEYWFFFLFNSIVGIVFTLLNNIVSGGSETGIFYIIYYLYCLAVLVPGLAVSWRRLHDIGKAGSFWFLVLIPVVGAIILLVWMCRDSQPEENAYGPSPKAGSTV